MDIDFCDYCNNYSTTRSYFQHNKRIFYINKSQLAVGFPHFPTLASVASLARGCSHGIWQKPEPKITKREWRNGGQRLAPAVFSTCVLVGEHSICSRKGKGRYGIRPIMKLNFPLKLRRRGKLLFCIVEKLFLTRGSARLAGRSFWRSARRRSLRGRGR